MSRRIITDKLFIAYWIQFRIEEKWGLGYAARKLGCHKQTLYQIEEKKRPLPDRIKHKAAYLMLTRKFMNLD